MQRFSYQTNKSRKNKRQARLITQLQTSKVLWIKVMSIVAIMVVQFFSKGYAVSAYREFQRVIASEK